MAGKKLSKLLVVSGLTASAAALFFFDPKHGSRRRAALAKGARGLIKSTGKEVAKSWKDAEHHFIGAMAHASTWLHPQEVSDEVLAERIRSRMGHLVCHPHRIKVACDQGVVTLWGTAIQREMYELLHAIKAMPGVKEVRNHLELHAFDEVSTLEQKTPHERWSRFKHLLAFLAGGTLAIYGLNKKGKRGAALSLLGSGIMARSAMKSSISSTLAIDDESPGFVIEKTLTIHAPVSDIFDFWVNPENYPQAFSHITSIERAGENLYRWTMKGPAGIPVGWEGIITRIVPNTLVEWKSLPGSLIGNSGVARFDPNYDASTRLHIRMFYRPPAGILGRFVAEFFGLDARKVLEEDLNRFKHLFERGEISIEQLRKAKEEEELLKLAAL